MKHSPDSTKRNKIDKQARYKRKLARRKLLEGLRKDSRSGYKKR